MADPAGADDERPLDDARLLAVGARAATRPLVVALDVGSSSVRAGVYDATGRPVRGAWAQVRYGFVAGADGTVRLPLAVLVEVTGTVLDALVARAGPLVGEAAGVGLSVFSHGVVGIDASGQPVTPLLSWADTASAADADALADETDPVALHQATGAPLHAGYWPARLRHLRRAFPSVALWCDPGAWLVRWLTGSTGRPVTSRATASTSGLLDRASGDWDAGLLAVVGEPEDALPALSDDLTVVGAIARPSHGRWPALEGLPISAPWPDGPCGNVGLDASGERRAALMIGTSSAMRLMLDGRPAVPAGLFAFLLAGRSVIGGQLGEGGGTVAWLSTLVRHAPAILERRAAAMGPGAEGVVALPFLTGERGVRYRARARGALVGLTTTTDAAALYRAILEGVALRLAEVDERLGSLAGERPEVVAAGGALLRSPLWRSIVADVLGRPVLVPAALEVSARGAALLAVRTVVAEAPPPAPLPLVVVEPDPERHARYHELLGRQRALDDALDPFWRT